MTKEIGARVHSVSLDFIEQNFADFRTFSKESGKNAVPSVGAVFGTMLRGVRGLGIDNTEMLRRVFETPARLFECFARCRSERQSVQLLNAGKL